MEYNDKSKENLIWELTELQKKYDSLKATFNNTNSNNANIESSKCNYNSIFNIISESIFIHDINSGKIIDVNDAMLKTYGYSSKDEVLNCKVSDLSANITPYDDEAAQIKLLETINKGPQTFDWIARKKDGTSFWIEIKLIKTTIGGEGRILALGRNINERKLMEQALKKSEKSLKDAQFCARIGNWEHNMLVPNDSWSDEMFRIFDCDPALGTPTALSFFNRIHPDDRNRFEHTVFQAIEDKKPFEEEYRIIRSNNNTRWLASRGEPIFDDNGNMIQYIGTVQDITERKSAEILLLEKSNEIEAQNEEYIQLIEELRQTNEELYIAKDKAQESEQQFRSVFENSKDAIGISKNGINVFCNKAMIDMFGYESQDEIIGKSILLNISPSEHERVKQLTAKRISGQPILNNIEILGIRKNGEEFPFETNIGSYNIRNGLYSIGIARDITERKKADAEIRQRTALFESLLNTSIDGILIVDHNRKKVFQNQRMSDLFNIPKEIANNIDDKYQLEYIISIMKDPEQSLSSVSYLYTHPLERYHNEVELKNGNVYDRYTAPVLSNDGYNYGRIWIFRDITERKQSEKMLIDAKENAEENERVKSTILEKYLDAQKMAAIGNWELNMITNKIWWSEGVYDIFETTPEEFIPDFSNYIALMLPEELDSFYKVFEHCLKTGSALNQDLSIKTAKGTIKHCNNQGKVEYDVNNNPVKFIGTIMDITWRKEIENALNLKNSELLKALKKAEESDRLKTAFLQNMSHEIRTPMNAIIGFSDLLYENADDKEKLKKFTGIISQRCNDLLDIITDILDISKIESGQLSVNIEECNLSSIFEELATFFNEYQNRTNKKHIEFSLQNYSKAIENVIFVDRVKLKQIFINLISNAFKFTDEGKIEGGCKLDSNQNLLFYVSDTGIGIPTDKQKMIFERFTQIHLGSKFNVGGTGLGLAIVKGLVDLLGGEISLISEPDKGSTFSFTIPYKTTQHLIHQPSKLENRNEKNLSNKTILIVEDDIYNVDYLKAILSSNSLTLLFAENGQKAIEISRSQPIDLVLMDIRLPDMNGYETTQHIMMEKPHLKIIAQTAFAASDERQKAFDAGCIDYISKPTKKDLLLSMLNKHLFTL